MGEIGGGHQNEGKDNGGLRIAGRQRRHLLGADHDGHPVADHITESRKQSLALGGLTMQQCDLLGILARPHQIETKIRFVLLLAEVETDQRFADQMRQYRTDDRIDQRAPDQIAGNIVLHAEHMQGCGGRQSPQDDHERAQGDHGVQEADADVEGLVDEQFHVVGDTLVGVVGGIAEQLHPVVIGVVQPALEIAAGHPGPPANLQPLVQVKLIDRQRDIDRGNNREVLQLVDEDVPVAFLQGVVEAAIPLVQQNVDRNRRQFDSDNCCEQYEAGEPVFGAKVRRGNPPDRRKCLAEILHNKLSPTKMLICLWNFGRGWGA